MLRVGVDIVDPPRVQRLVGRFPERIGRLLRAEERGGEFDDASLFAAKEAVVKAVGGLSIFDGGGFAITKVRGGHAAIPRAAKFETRLVEAGLSWVAVCRGEAHGASWALAIGLPGDIRAFDAVLAVRYVAQAMAEPDRLDNDSAAELDAKPNPDLSRAARQTAIRAADILLGAFQGTVGVRSRSDDSLCFTRPPQLQSIPLSIAHDGNYVIGAVARPAAIKRLRADTGTALQLVDIA